MDRAITISFTVSSEGLLFECSGLDLPPLLAELLDNGQALPDPEGILVPHEEIVRLDRADQEILNLPPQYPLDILIRSRGQLNQKGLVFDLKYCRYDGGDFLKLDRIGCLLLSNNDPQYLLSQHQLDLVEAVAEFNELPEKNRTFKNNLIHFSEIKNLSLKSGTLLDSYLKNEEVIIP